jgi:hypothetical protein
VQYTLIETPEFNVQRARLLPDEVYRKLQERLLADPNCGKVIPDTGGIRKVRVGMRGKGTRSGGRVIYLVRRQSGRIHLLTCFAKSEQTDLTAARRRVLRKLAGQLT